MSKGYNGHSSWTLWNVSLWVGNDEGLYNLARESITYTRNRQDAAARMLDYLNSCGIEKTPDGARYSKRAILHAMRGM